MPNPNPLSQKEAADSTGYASEVESLRRAIRNSKPSSPDRADMEKQLKELLAKPKHIEKLEEASADAIFIGWQHAPFACFPLFNISRPGHARLDSTVTIDELEKENLVIPEYPAHPTCKYRPANTIALSQKEISKEAAVGDEEFSYDELSQPAAEKPKEAPTPEVKKEEPKAEVKEEPKSSEPKKEEEAKKGSHPSIDDLNKDWGKYWTSNTSDLTSAMGLAFKDGKALCNATVSFNGGDWAAQGVVEIALTRDANKLWVVINPQGLVDMMGSVADKYAAAKESAHVFQPLRFLPRVLELMAKKVSDTLEYKLKGMGLRGSDVLTFKMADATAFKEATDSAKNAVNSVATEHTSKYQGAAPKEKKEKKPTKQDIDAKLEKAFDDIPAADWEIREIKKHNLRAKTIFLPLKDYPAVAEALGNRDMGKVGPYQFLMRAQNTLHVIDTSAYNYASWVGPKMERLSELLGDELSKSASATAASMTARLSSLEALEDQKQTH